MKPYALFVDYMPLEGETRRHLPPTIVEASNDEEASRAASAVANFAYPEFCRDLLIRITGPVEGGQVIGEVRRPNIEI